MPVQSVGVWATGSRPIWLESPELHEKQRNIVETSDFLKVPGSARSPHLLTTHMCCLSSSICSGLTMMIVMTT